MFEVSTARRGDRLTFREEKRKVELLVKISARKGIDLSDYLRMALREALRSDPLVTEEEKKAPGL